MFSQYTLLYLLGGTKTHHWKLLSRFVSSAELYEWKMEFYILSFLYISVFYRKTEIRTSVIKCMNLIRKKLEAAHGDVGQYVSTANRSRTKCLFSISYTYLPSLDCHMLCFSHCVCRCFIMEDRGYLVAHPTLIDPKGHAPAEQQHITHKVAAHTLLLWSTAHKRDEFARFCLCSGNGEKCIHVYIFVTVFLISFPLCVICKKKKDWKFVTFYFFYFAGAAGGKRYPQPPKLCEEEAV